MLKTLKSTPKLKTTFAALIIAAVAVAGILILLNTRAAEETTTTRLGLHVTQEELDIWRERWANGDADSFVNTRISEEKNRVINNKNTFMANQSQHLYMAPRQYQPDPNQPPQDCMVAVDSNICGSGSYYAEFDGGGLGSVRTRAARARDAAFYGLINRDAAVLSAVKTWLKTQPAQPTLQYQNSPPWHPDMLWMKNAAVPHFATAHFMIPHLIALDYVDIAIKEGLISDYSATDRNAIKTWHQNYTKLLEPTNTWRANWGFVKRLENNYDLNSLGGDPDNLWTTDSYRNSSGTIIGPKIHRLHNTYNNRDASVARAMMLFGLYHNDQFLVDRSKLWLRDFIRYTVFPEGITSDWHRHDIWPGYSTLHLSHAITAVDAYTRATGDTSLYDLETTVGAHDTAGAPKAPATDAGKSYRFIMESMVRHAKSAYSTDRWTGAGSHKMDYRNDAKGQGNRGFHDRFLPATIYYSSSGMLRDWYRGENGVHPWKVTGNGTTDLNDAWVFPAPYLMWAGLEGQVWPYNPDGGGTTPPPPPEPTPPPPEPTPSPPAPTDAYADQVLASNPAGYWRMEETSGTSLTDSSGSGHTATAHNSNLNVSGPLNIGSEIQLNGPANDSWVSLGTPTTDTNLDAWTWELWVQADSNTTIASTPGLMGERTHEQGSLIRMVTASGGWQPQIRIFRKSDLAYVGANVGAATTPFGERIHLAVTVSGAQTGSPTVRLFKNGQLVFTKTDINSALMPPYREQAIGIRDSGTINTFFSGRIDEPAIYPTALTATQIKAHYDAATTDPEPEPTTPGDLDNSGTVDIIDLSILLDNWGSNDSTADLNDDGTVNVIDLSILLDNWGS